VLLDIKKIHCHYGALEALKGVSMEIAEGSVVGLLGANGSGKSTIMKAVSGMMKPTQGEIWFDGRRIDGMPAHKVIRTGIVHVPEGRRLFPFMTVFENLRMGAYCRKDKEGIAEDLEKLCQRYPILAKRKNRVASTLSGGEQAQLAIARGLMSRPKMLLLDEPLQGLAPLVIGDIEEMILELNRDGMTVLMVEHNVHMALGMSHKIYILGIGEVVMEGHPKELSESEYVQKVYLAK
jgi:branched-chain amino acid transport system ATP-binding protein